MVLQRASRKSRRLLSMQITDFPRRSKNSHMTRIRRRHLKRKFEFPCIWIFHRACNKRNDRGIRYWEDWYDLSLPWRYGGPFFGTRNATLRWHSWDRSTSLILFTAFTKVLIGLQENLLASWHLSMILENVQKVRLKIISDVNSYRLIFNGLIIS